MATYSVRTLTQFATRGLALSILITTPLACSSEDPSFKDERGTTRLELTVEGDESSADALANQTEALPSEQESDTIFDELNGDAEPAEGSTSDGAGESTSDGDSSASADGASGDAATESGTEVLQGEGSTSGSAAGSETLGSIGGSSGSTTSDDGSGDSSSGSGDSATGSGGSSSGDAVSSEGSSSGGTTSTSDGSSGSSSGDTAESGSDPVPEGGLADSLSANERNACAKLLGVKAEQIKVVGNKTSRKISANAALAVKVAGNQSHLELSIGSASSASIAGICLFVTGNQGRADVNLGTDVGRVVYVGRGNRSHGDLEVKDGATLWSLAGDLRGNQASLNVHGAGTFPCKTVRTGGNDASFTCE